MTFAYNGLGDRLQQTIGGLTAQYTLDINNSLSQVLADGTDRYLYGMGRIAQQTPGGWQYFLPDALGSARQLTDATGALVLAQSFDPYGGLLASQGTAVTPYGFAGEWGDAGGLLYLRARYYLPQAGIFTAGDTWAGDFTAPASLNRYIYARNNPLRYIDPTGHDVWDTIGEFSTGMVYEFAWASSWVSPQRPWILAPSSCESVARLAGRSVGDILAILAGMDWLVSGAGGAGAGLTMCGTGVLCPAGVGVLAASGVAVAAGGVLTVGGAVGLGENLAMMAGSGRGQNSSGGLFASNNIPTQPHFWDRLSEYGWTEDQAFKVYQNGKKYTNQYGQNVRWDPKSGLTLIIDPDDGRVITPEWNPKPLRNWERGWFDPK